MSATLDLFIRWKAAKGIASDRSAAAELGISHAGPAQWRAGRNGSASVIERMARDLGEDPIPVILQAFAEAARDADDRKTLAKLARRLGAAVVLLMLAPMMIPGSAKAAETGLSEGGRNIHYALFLNRLRQWLRSVITGTVSRTTMPAWWRPFNGASPCNRIALFPASP